MILNAKCFKTSNGLFTISDFVNKDTSLFRFDVDADSNTRVIWLSDLELRALGQFIQSYLIEKERMKE